MSYGNKVLTLNPPYVRGYTSHWETFKDTNDTSGIYHLVFEDMGTTLSICIYRINPNTHSIQCTSNVNPQSLSQLYETNRGNVTCISSAGYFNMVDPGYYDSICPQKNYKNNGENDSAFVKDHHLDSWNCKSCRPIFTITDDMCCEILPEGCTDATGYAQLANTYQFAFGGGPLLVKDGKNMCSDIHGSGKLKDLQLTGKTVSEHFKHDNKWYEWGNAKTTRMAIGYTDPSQAIYLIYANECTLYDFASGICALNIQQAMNLDGGDSAGMISDTQKQNENNFSSRIGKYYRPLKTYISVHNKN